MTEIKTLKSLDWNHVGAFAVLGLVIFYIAHVGYQWYRLSHIPGPFWASFSQIWITRQILKGNLPKSLYEAHEKYGHLVRVGPNHLVTDDPNVLQKMLAVRSNYSRSQWFTITRLDPDRDHLVSLMDETAHTALRKKMVAGYSGKENLSMESTIQKQVSNLVNLIERKYITTKQDYRPMDLSQTAQFFTTDVISDLAFGQAFGSLPNDADVSNYIKITEAMLLRMAVLSSFPLVVRVIRSQVFRCLFRNEANKLGFGPVIDDMKKLVGKRYEPGARQHQDMLGSFMRHGLSEEEAAGESLLQLVAGSDTSAATIRFIMLYIITNHDFYKRLQGEIDDAISEGKISSPAKDSEARKLPYLQAVIKEGLRIRPAVGGQQPRAVPKGGDVINGQFIPAGTEIGMSSFSIHHNKETFGADAETFRPDRWLEAHGDRLKLMNSTVDLVFYHGKYKCLGKPVALMEFNILFVELFRRFDFSILNPLKPANITFFNVWLFEDFFVRVTDRETRA